MENKVEGAIKESVKEEGQPDQLAEKIIAWMKALASGNEDIDDSQAAAQHIWALYNSVETSGMED